MCDNMTKPILNGHMDIELDVDIHGSQFPITFCVDYNTQLDDENKPVSKFYIGRFVTGYEGDGDILIRDEM